MNFDFLKKYVVNKDSKVRLRHTFYAVDPEVMQRVNNVLTIPVELKEFYQSIGYGFMLDTVDESINRFLDPGEFKKMNLREEYYQYDPTLEIFSLPFYEDKLIFFEVNEGVYLLVDRYDTEGKNAVYFFEKKIAESLEGFLHRFDTDPYFFQKN